MHVYSNILQTTRIELMDTISSNKSRGFGIIGGLLLNEVLIRGRLPFEKLYYWREKKSMLLGFFDDKHSNGDYRATGRQPANVTLSIIFTKYILETLR